MPFSSFFAFNECLTIYYLPKEPLSLLRCKVGKSFSILQVGTWASVTYHKVTIAGHEPLAGRKNFQKSFLLPEGILLTFVE